MAAQVPGNILNVAAKIRTDASKRPWGPQTAGDVADAFHGLQDQTNRLNTMVSGILASASAAAIAPPPGVTLDGDPVTY